MGFQIILIAGPTASGKSSIALQWAQKNDGVIINCDSMQVYGDLPILSACPSVKDMKLAPHDLFGHVDGAEAYSVGRYLQDVAPRLARWRAEGRAMVFVGGTGLYFKALTLGLSAIPAVPDELRAALRMRAETLTSEDLHVQLQEQDPIMAERLRPSDRQRILRALEVVLATGRSLSVFQTQRQPALTQGFDYRAIFLAPEREDLRRAIDARFDLMMANGAMAEVEQLATRDLDPILPVMRTLGVPSLIEALRGALSLDEAVAQSKAATRGYARRQFTFARHQLPQFTWVAPERALAHLLC